MPNREVNVYSPQVIACPGETITWFAESGAFDNCNVSVQGSTWPLTPSSLTLTSSAPSGTMNVPSTATVGTVYDFSCMPTDPDVSQQKLIIGRVLVSELCSDVQVNAGDNFVWQNTGSQTVTISSDDPDDWPLDHDQIEIAAGQWFSVGVAGDAETKNYTVNITYPDGTSPCGAMATQPKIMVSGGPAGVKK